MAVVPIIKYISYEDLVRYMGSPDFIVEPSIENCEFEFRGFNQDETILFGLQYKLRFFHVWLSLNHSLFLFHKGSGRFSYCIESILVTVIPNSLTPRSTCPSSVHNSEDKLNKSSALI